MRGLWRIAAALAALVWIDAPASAAPAGPGYDYYEIGDTAVRTPGPVRPGLLLNGGGGWPKEAFRWFADRAGHGHVVILRASGAGDAGEEMYREIGGLASVQTIVFHAREAANEPRLLAILAHADGIFIAGGDQSNYVRFWQGTAVARALDRHVAAGRPLGGTSAGLAILGSTAYGALDGGSVDSVEALRDPLGPKVTLVTDFLHVRLLAHVVTDTHFTTRDRIGRLTAFLAQARMKGDAKTVGLGVDEATALCVDGDGVATLYSDTGGHGWLVQPLGMPPAKAGQPLDWPAIRITGIGADSRLDLKTLTVERPAFASVATVRDGRVEGLPVMPGARWSLAIHGGAGVVPRGSLTAEEDAAYRKGLAMALDAGRGVLSKGGSSIDAVEAALRVLEDDPRFNAGKGAVFDADGVNQLDAAIMDGATLRAGGVTGVTRTKNPISLARTVLERSPHVLLSGAGADAFSREQGLSQVEPGYFRTDQRWSEYLEWRRDHAAAPDPTHRFGTVGAVALDMRNHLAAGTSTGGLTGKRWGRIGDSPLIGAGTFAADGDCAVSATGTGEYFIRETAARQICDRIAWKGETVAQAAANTIEAIGDIGGDGGVIALDGQGHVGFAFNTEGMYRGLISSDHAAQTAIMRAKRPISHSLEGVRDRAQSAPSAAPARTPTRPPILLSGFGATSESRYVAQLCRLRDKELIRAVVKKIS